MKFALHLTSDSEKCDYRFACNEALHVFEALSVNAAITAALDTIGEGHYNEITPSFDGHKISHATLYQVSREIDIDLVAPRVAAVTKAMGEVTRKNEAKELAELARLKRKYG